MHTQTLVDSLSALEAQLPPDAAVLGIGVDICQIARIAKAHRRFGHRWLDKMLTLREQELYQQRAQGSNTARAAAFLATRFAAKEAIYKALSASTPRHLLHWQSCSVLPLGTGAPHVVFDEPLAAYIQGRHWVVHLSLSDEQAQAIAFCILCKEHK